MDRANWKFGEFNINILTLGVTYKDIAVPLLFSLLGKRGDSNWEERKAIMERFIRLFGHGCIDCLVADREFIGKVDWMAQRQQNSILHPYPAGHLDCQALHRRKRIRAWWLFNSLKVGQEKFYYKKPFCIKGSMFILPEVESRGCPSFRF